MKEDDLVNKNRKKRFAIARKLFCAICKREGFKMEAIGMFLNRDHSTVVHHCKSTVAQIIKENPKYNLYFNRISRA